MRVPFRRGGWFQSGWLFARDRIVREFRLFRAGSLGGVCCPDLTDLFGEGKFDTRGFFFDRRTGRVSGFFQLVGPRKFDAGGLFSHGRLGGFWKLNFV